MYGYCFINTRTKQTTNTKHNTVNNFSQNKTCWLNMFVGGGDCTYQKSKLLPLLLPLLQLLFLMLSLPLLLPPPLLLSLLSSLVSLSLLLSQHLPLSLSPARLLCLPRFLFSLSLTLSESRSAESVSLSLSLSLFPFFSYTLLSPEVVGSGSHQRWLAQPRHPFAMAVMDENGETKTAKIARLEAEVPKAELGW
jgi:hypothetical protein